MELELIRNSAQSDPEWKEVVFEICSLRNDYNILLRGIAIAEQVDMFLMLCHDKSLHYLDLAVEPCLRSDHAMFETIRNLPLPCAEYLNVEYEIPENTSLGKMFWVVNQFQRKRLRFCENNRTIFARVWYRNYTSIFFERFEGLDRIQRRASVRPLLRTHRILQIRVFQTRGYQSLIRECTSPEPDPALTVELLMTLLNTDLLKIRGFVDAPPGSLETLLCHAKVMRFDFWGLWRGIGGLNAIFKPVAEFITLGRYSCAKILLKYGFPYSSDERIYQRQCFLLIGRRLRNMFVITYQEYILLRLQQNQARMMLIMIAFMAYAGLDEAGDTHQDSVSTLAFLMQCVPDPYVNPSEMLRELKPVVLESFADDLQRITNTYAAANVFGEKYDVYTPRTLVHLCRCVIRGAIAKNLGLPEGINELNVPKPIRKYLSLEA